MHHGCLLGETVMQLVKVQLLVFSVQVSACQDVSADQGFCCLVACPTL
jgi:hypothetical protein